METQYIHLNAVRTSLQVITTVQIFKDKNWMKWSRPAALSTNDPKRNVQGGWKTPACKEVEVAMRTTSVMARIRQLVRC